jgi:hypothetical protein
VDFESIHSNDSYGEPKLVDKATRVSLRPPN